jgi:hypothetical protein
MPTAVQTACAEPICLRLGSRFTIDGATDGEEDFEGGHVHEPGADREEDDPPENDWRDPPANFETSFLSEPTLSGCDG